MQLSVCFHALFDMFLPPVCIRLWYFVSFFTLNTKLGFEEGHEFHLFLSTSLRKRSNFHRRYVLPLLHLHLAYHRPQMFKSNITEFAKGVMRRTRPVSIEHKNVRLAEGIQSIISFSIEDTRGTSMLGEVSFLGGNVSYLWKLKNKIHFRFCKTKILLKQHTR